MNGVAVLFAGTMKVDQVETPFLYLNDADPEGDSAAIHPNYVPDILPGAAPPSTLAPYEMPVAELRHALGLLETDEHGIVSLPRPKWAHADEFGLQRQELYGGEASVVALSRGLPGMPALRTRCLSRHVSLTASAPLILADGWRVFMSRSEPREPFYFHVESNLTQWERPV